MTTLSDNQIAIVALGAIYPGRGDTLGFWRDILEGVDTMETVPESHWLREDYYDADPMKPDHTYGQRGGFIQPQAFDPMGFGIPPSALPSTDTSQLLALMAADKVLREAEMVSGGKLSRERTSVILGIASATELTGHMSGRLQRPIWINAMREAGLPETQVQELADRISAGFVDWDEATFPGLLGNVVAGRIANRLDLGGCNYVADAACASSLAAVKAGVHELTSGDSDTVLVGGADTLNDIFMYMCFSKTPALSPTGDCRPFSDQADGTMLGEGIGIIALRRLEDAERDGNRIYGVIRGIGSGSDGKATAIYAPRSGGQARALKRAYVDAGYGPETVGLVEAHGTGTKAGDAAELGGLMQVFDADETSEAPWCALGSIKSQIGHTKAAAGAASFLKITQALAHKILPPTIKVEKPAATLERQKAFYINSVARPWINANKHPRRASASAFGFGGTNYHIAVEEYVGKNGAPVPRCHAAELVLISDANPMALADELEALAAEIKHEDDLAAVAAESHADFSPGAPARLAIVASTHAEFAEKTARVAKQLRSSTPFAGPFPAGVTVSGTPDKSGKTAFLFSGQGSQYVGMGADIAMAFSAARDVWDKAARTGGKLHEAAFPAAPFTDAEAKAQTAHLTAMENAQPAIAATALSQLALLKALSLKADCTGGHSFGELVALHHAGMFTARECLSLAKLRGASMAKAALSSEGAMLAVQAGAVEVRKAIGKQGGKTGSRVVIANDNAPDQVVLSGAVAAIEAVAKKLKTAGYKTHRLPVASAFHSEIVAAAVGPFHAGLKKAKARKLNLPVYQNATARPYTGSIPEIAAQLAGQIETPVRFREMIEAMYADGARTFIEVGPGNVLGGLVRNILGDKDGLNVVSLDAKRQNGLVSFLGALGGLACSGHGLDMAALYKNLPAPEKQPERPKHAIDISGVNVGKPYPPQNGVAGRAEPNPDPQPGVLPETPVPVPELPVDTPTPPQQDFIDPTPTHTSEDTSVSNFISDQRLALMQQIYQDMAARHAEYLNQTSNAHAAFMVAAAGLIGTAPMAAPAMAQTPAMGGSNVPMETIAPAPMAPPMPAPVFVAPVAAPAPALAPVPPAAMMAQIAPTQIMAAAPAPAPIAAPAPAPVAAAPAPAPVAAPTAPIPAPTPAAAPQANGAANGSIVGLIKGLVSDKTGYPTDMLDEDMDLEAELGVDSIKQVEILSALREAMPDLPDVEPDQIAELRTIRKIADFFG